MISHLRALWNQRFFRLLLLAGVLLAIAGRLDLTALRAVLARFNLAYGCAMLAVNAVLLLLFALRWRCIARLLGIAAPLGQFVRVTWLSACLSELGPPLLVGEITRFQLMRQFGEQRRLLLSQLADRLSGYAVLGGAVLLLSPAYAGWFGLPSGRWPLLVAGAFGVGAVLLVRQPQIRAVLNAIPRRLVMRSAPHYAYSLLIQTLLSVNLLLAAAGLGVAQQPGAILMLAPLLLLGISALPSLWSDWGKREAAALFVLAPAGLTPEQALAISLLFGFSHLLATLPGWCLLWLKPPTHRKNNNLSATSVR
ncbi:MAG: hypothetical protein EPN21_12870 [Methylococcaceae bacterium]|nr:MAG: hypothetical protein EPN21_12870 [Methylococcaceae bacterium]